MPQIERMAIPSTAEDRWFPCHKDHEGLNMKKNLEDFTTKEIEAELSRRENISKELKFSLWAKTEVSENGVRPEDLLIIAFPEPAGDGFNFGLALKKKWKKNKYLSDDWDEYSDWHSILPGNFAEASENCYEFNDGSFQYAVDLLKKCGFTVIQYDWETQIEKAL